MLVYIKDEDDTLVIPVGLGPNCGPGAMLQEKVIELSELEGDEVTLTPDAGYDGFSKITIIIDG